MKICILGLGYIGLPTAAMFANYGVKVLGVDVKENVVEALNRGKVLIEEPDLKALVHSAVEKGNLRASTEPGPADAFIICVPTPLTEKKSAELSYVKSAAESILPHLKKGNLIILESTVPPGTTTDVLVPILQRSGLSCKEDISVAFCPERVMPGRILHELVHNDRVIGGYTRKGSDMAVDLYRSFVKGELFITDATTAEFVKLAENTYRDVNIALANEYAKMCQDCSIDVWEMTELANRHPRVEILRPGPGVGGHCIAIDPWYLVDTFGKTAKLIKASRDVNDSMPEHVFHLIEKHSRKGKVALLGTAYKADVDDDRESPSLILAGILKEKGWEPVLSDPFVKSEGIVPFKEAVSKAKCAVILTDHSTYKNLGPEDFEGVDGIVVIDTRNVLDAHAFEKAGITLVRLGNGKN